MPSPAVVAVIVGVVWMGDKEVKSFTIDEENAVWISENPHLNASSLVDGLITAYRLCGDATEAALELRLDKARNRLQTRRDQLAQKSREVEMSQQEVEMLETRIENYQETDIPEVTALARLVEEGAESGNVTIEITRDQLTPDNELVQNRAEKAGMAVDEFLNELEAELNGGSA